jgi:hypothetical protein
MLPPTRESAVRAQADPLGGEPLRSGPTLGPPTDSPAPESGRGPKASGASISGNLRIFDAISQQLTTYRSTPRTARRSAARLRRVQPEVEYLIRSVDQ